MLERPNQHLYDCGHMRELTVTGQANVKKRVLVQFKLRASIWDW